jgi:hypothetical protein
MLLFVLAFLFRHSTRGRHKCSTEHPSSYGDLIYKLKKIKDNAIFSTLLVKTICKFKKERLPTWYPTAFCMPGDKPIYSWSLCLPLWLNDCGRGLRVFEGLWANLVKEHRSSKCFFYPCHRVLADLTPGDQVTVRSLCSRPFTLLWY